jgi:exodeoxyribonuclease-1
MPLAAHPQENNGILIYDLAIDPTPWLEMKAAELAKKLFLAKKDLQEGESRLPVSVLHTNRCPAIAPISVMYETQRKQSSINWSKSHQHWNLLRSKTGFLSELMIAIQSRVQMSAGEKPIAEDPDEQIYSGGFFSDADKRLMSTLRSMTATELAARHDHLCSQFKDTRLAEMLFRYRARNFRSTLNTAELKRWRLHCRQQCLNVDDNQPTDGLNLFSCRIAIQQERSQCSDSQSMRLLDELESWLLSLESWAATEAD